jgi:uncharacterized protein
VPAAADSPAATDSTAATDSSAAASATDPVKPAVRKIQYEPTKPVDLLDAAGSPVLKRAAPAAAAVLLLLWLIRKWRQ